MDMERRDEVGRKRAKATMASGRAISIGMGHRDSRVEVLKLHRLGGPNLIGYGQTIIGLGSGASRGRKNDRKQRGRMF